LAVGTRPDCLGAEILALLQSFHQKAFLWVEVGMQTRHNITLRAMNRGHLHDATVDAMRALEARGIRTVLHLILGIPGETPDMVRGSLEEAARLSPWGVKLHPFHVVHGSALEEAWRRGDLSLLDLRDYTQLACDGLERFHPDTVVHRLTGERPEGVLLAPGWCRGKGLVLHAIQEEFGRRGTSQGSRWR
jgi:radical SAM protein (TIGR01212 family)